MALPVPDVVRALQLFENDGPPADLVRVAGLADCSPYSIFKTSMFPIQGVYLVPQTTEIEFINTLPL